MTSIIMINLESLQLITVVSILYHLSNTIVTTHYCHPTILAVSIRNLKLMMSRRTVVAIMTPMVLHRFNVISTQTDIFGMNRYNQWGQ